MIKCKKSKKQESLHELVRLKINEKTWVYVKPGLTDDEIKTIKDRYNSKIK